MKFHLTNVYRKLGVGNRTEASRWAQRHGLLADDAAASPDLGQPAGAARSGATNSRQCGHL